MTAPHSLLPPARKPPPPGSIRPAGWLAGQLRTQAAGLSGHLDDLWPDVADSALIGGAAEGWERGPCWLDRRRVPGWGLAHGAAAPPPGEPGLADGPPEALALVPSGCTNLRVSELLLARQARG